ncbi:hypothetical protein SNEBB_008869 [Seison nebaliae]|nr:hypothetical protein SNEBB_008869 [Seison nebaliae]
MIPMPELHNKVLLLDIILIILPPMIISSLTSERLTVTKKISFVAEYVKGTRKEISTVKNEDLSLSTKVKVCERKIKFKDYKRDNILWHVDNVEFTDVTLKGKTINCVTEVIMVAQVAKKDYKKAVEDNSKFEGFDTSSFSIDKPFQEIIHHRINKFKLFLSVGVVGALLAMFCIACIFTKRRTGKARKGAPRKLLSKGSSISTAILENRDVGGDILV